MDMQTEEKKRTGVCREAFSDFRKRYGIWAFAAAALVLIKYVCFYSFMGISNHFILVCALSCLLVFLFFCAFFKPFPNPHIDILTKPCANRIGKKGHASAQPSFLLQSYDLLI